jgi:hypothetical protein
VSTWSFSFRWSDPNLKWPSWHQLSMVSGFALFCVLDQINWPLQHDTLQDHPFVSFGDRWCSCLNLSAAFLLGSVALADWGMSLRIGQVLQTIWHMNVLLLLAVSVPRAQGFRGPWVWNFLHKKHFAERWLCKISHISCILTLTRANDLG